MLDRSVINAGDDVWGCRVFNPVVPHAVGAHPFGGSNIGMDDDERQALRAEGLDPDDPAVVAAIDLVRWELSLICDGAD